MDKNLKNELYINDGLKEHDVVFLKRDLNGVLKGAMGTIIHEYSNITGGVFMVEFFDEKSNKYFVETVSENDLSKL